MNRLVIIGAGGHGKVIADIALKNGYTDICFVDDHANGKCIEFPIVGKCDSICELNDGKTDFVIGIGNNATRKNIAEKYDANWVTLIHPSAQIGINVSIGSGTVVMAGAVINPCTRIGEHCIINTSAVIDHDNVIEDYVHISPRAVLSGTVRIGKETWIGTGTSVINNVSICNEVVVGVGSVVIKDIKNKGTYFGTITSQN